MIKLPFEGIKGEDEVKPVTISVPCMEMYGEQCPILTEIRPWFSTELDEMARRYWKKRSYLFQGFVQKDGLGEKETPENPIRRFVLAPQLFKLVKAALLDPEMEDIPTDYDNGVDFRVIKNKTGKYAEYTTSAWARRESALTQEQLQAIEEYGLFNLSDFLPQKPDEEALEAIVAMFEASVNGQMYDPAKWSKFYKPYGYNAENTTTDSDSTKITSNDSAPTVKMESTETTVEAKSDEVPSENPPPMSSQDILAKLKARTGS
jgi:hypothetical protein